ncbi:hypothetical protein ACFL30_02515 [Candidatus Latescibacterota bacterium]
MNSDHIEILVDTTPTGVGKAALPTAKMASYVVAKVSKDALIASLCELVEHVNDILKNVGLKQERARLEFVSISAHVISTVSIQWIGGLSTGLTNAMTLEFKILESEYGHNT